MCEFLFKNTFDKEQVYYPGFTSINKNITSPFFHFILHTIIAPKKKQTNKQTGCGKRPTKPPPQQPLNHHHTTKYNRDNTLDTYGMYSLIIYGQDL